MHARLSHGGIGWNFAVGFWAFKAVEELGDLQLSALGARVRVLEPAVGVHEAGIKLCGRTIHAITDVRACGFVHVVERQVVEIDILIEAGKAECVVKHVAGLEAVLSAGVAIPGDIDS